MAYIGNNLQVAFPSYRIIDDISGSFNGSLKTFALKVSGAAPVPFPINPQQCLISVNGVVQKPDPTGASGFNLSGTNIVFATAPTGGWAFFGIILAGADYVNVGANFPSGTAAAPSITFDSNTTTGVYLASSNVLGFATGGTQRITIDSNGNFNLSGSGSAASPAIKFGAGIAGLYSPGTDQVAISTNGTQRLLIDSTGTISANSDVAVPNTKAYMVRDSGGTSRYAMYMSGSLSPSAGNDLFVGNTLNNNLIFYTNGTERVRVTNDGKVGLGTSTVGNALHIVTSSTTATARGITLSNTNANTANGMAEIDFYTDQYDGSTLNNKARITASLDASSPTAGYLAFSTRKSGVMTEAVRIDSQSRVGIGTTSPGSTLDVAGNINVQWSTNRIATVFDNDYRQGLAFDSTNRQLRIFSTTNDTGGSIGFYTRNGTGASSTDYGTERARIDSSGRLLVGTSSARSVGTTVSFNTLAESTAYAGYAAITNRNDPDGAYIALGKTRGTSVGSNTIVQANDVLGAIIFGGADGTDVESRAAEITCNVDGTPGVNDMPGRLVFSTTADGASSPTERMRISSAGTVNVFSSDQGFNSRIAATSATNEDIFIGRHSATSTSSGTISFLVKASGNVQNTNNSYGAISDLKLKENIVDASSQWGDLKSLRVVKYNLKPETNQGTHTQIGLIAQEVELVSPGLVSESPDRDADGNDLGTVTKSVNYSVLYMKAVKALQEAMERIEALEQRLADAGIA